MRRLDQLLATKLAERESQSLLRKVVEAQWVAPDKIRVDGREYINFASNDYLGLAHHPQLIETLRSGAVEYGTGAGAAPLVSGHTPAHAAAEQALAHWKGTEAAVLLPSGYQAAHALIQTLAAVPGVRFLLDRLCHASLLDAVGATGAEMRIFPHNGLAKVGRLLQSADANRLQVVLAESIYSMDGDAAPLAEMCRLVGDSRAPAALVLDEAHGSGVYGPGGAGLAAELGLGECVDVYLVTLSKAIGLCGGAICGSRVFCDAVRNFGRAYIFSTAMSPAIAAAVPAALRILREEPHRQKRVRELALRMRSALKSAGRQIPEGDSPIIPILLGDEVSALREAERLKEAGLWVQPIRPPTVRRGTSRLRITLSCEHTDEQVERLVRVFLSRSS